MKSLQLYIFILDLSKVYIFCINAIKYKPHYDANLKVFLDNLKLSSGMINKIQKQSDDVTLGRRPRVQLKSLVIWSIQGF